MSERNVWLKTILICFPYWCPLKCVQSNEYGHFRTCHFRVYTYCRTIDIYMCSLVQAHTVAWVWLLALYCINVAYIVSLCACASLSKCDSSLDNAPLTRSKVKEWRREFPRNQGNLYKHPSLASPLTQQSGGFSPRWLIALLRFVCQLLSTNS